MVFQPEEHLQDLLQRSSPPLSAVRVVSGSLTTVKCGQGFSTNSGFGSAPLLAQGSRASPASLSQQRATRRDWEGYNYTKSMLFAKPQRCRNRNRNLQPTTFPTNSRARNAGSSSYSMLGAVQLPSVWRGYAPGRMAASIQPCADPCRAAPGSPRPVGPAGGPWRRCAPAVPQAICCRVYEKVVGSQA